MFGMVASSYRDLELGALTIRLNLARPRFITRPTLTSPPDTPKYCGNQGPSPLPPTRSSSLFNPRRPPRTPLQKAQPFPYLVAHHAVPPSSPRSLSASSAHRSLSRAASPSAAAVAATASTVDVDVGAQPLSFSPDLDMEADQYSSALGAHEEDDEEAFVRGMTGQHHGAPDNGANSYAHADFGQNIDPTLNGHAHAPHAPQNPHHAQSAQLHHEQQRQQHPQHTQHHQDPTAHYADAQMQRHLYGPPGGGYAMHTPSENLSEASPGQFTSVSPAPQHGTQRLAPAFTPQDRSLPSKDVTDETIDDAYVAFILYCNPSVPLDTDTTELRKVFRQPPKSDGKTFNVFHLMELIEKFERKDIKTWTKLAIELGVERTAESSAQKVQQYAVRLKVERPTPVSAVHPEC